MIVGQVVAEALTFIATWEDRAQLVTRALTESDQRASLMARVTEAHQPPVLATGSFAMRPTIQRPNWWPMVASVLSVGGLVIASNETLAAWNFYFPQPDGKLHVTFFDLGDGASILIQTPSGRYALIDGGPSPNGLAESLGARAARWRTVTRLGCGRRP